MDTNSFTPIRKEFHYADLKKFHTYSVNFCGQLPYLNVTKSKEKLKKKMEIFCYVLIKSTAFNTPVFMKLITGH